MDGIRNDDPFSWSVETVSKELCAPGRPWTRDPSALARRIQDEEIDGCTLLTYEFIYSKKELMECLDIKIARHKAALGHAIIGFQASSKEFRSWKKDFVSKQALDLSDNEPDAADNHISAAEPTRIENTPSKVIADTPLSPDQSVSRAAADLGDTAVHEENSSILLQSDSVPAIQLPNGEESHLSKPQTTPKDDLPASPRQQGTSLPALTPADDDRPSKRRRVAPINLSTKPLTTLDLLPSKFGSSNRSDGADKSSTRRPSLAGGISTLHAYLGRGILDIAAIKSYTGSPSSELMKHGEDAFAILTTNNLPPGQRRVVGRTLKKLFIRNARKEALVKQGIVPMRSPSASEEGDEILDLDDLPDSWDEETQREIDEEKAEIAAREQELARCLTQDRVEAILKESIEEMKSKWEEIKLPRYQRKAYKLWTDARRRERTKRKIIEAQQQAEFYEGRIKKLCAEILKDKWQKEQEVRNQARVMEQNLEDKLYRLWLMDLMESRVQPPKPKLIPKPATPAKARSALMDDEVLTSSDEDDFIVADEEDEDEIVNEKSAHGTAYSPILGDYDSPLPFNSDSSMVMDLTQVPSPEKAPNRDATRVYIDLTTPIKPKAERATTPVRQEAVTDLLADAPSIDQLESVETIGEFPGGYWAKQKDRWRLVICLIWKLPQLRRQWILRVVQNNSTEDAWQASIQRQLSHPLTQESQIGMDETRTSAYDLTKIFLGFLRCRSCKDARIMDLEKKDKNRLRGGERETFHAFCTFIKEIAPEFPQDSQIFRTDAFDDEIGLDEDDDEAPPSVENTPSKPRKHVAKEIVQNKEAVDLREREKRRAEEQEVRRLKLRAALATSNFMARDQSRLIINESKQEDQPFIYVNEDIGKRIKNHQIEGVRFLWNQITNDVDVRQGCLLAHTMGLGKTMQVITFLVAILEAANSNDASVRDQIPEDLRKSQTLVLCPSGLVDNWMDEVLLWAPEGLLGNLHKIEALMSSAERHSTIRDWERVGGVLVMGYEMFKRTCEVADLETVLVNIPSIVIADEAHVLKNPNTQVHRVCAKFQTRSRIALTGSPLSNNVEEYWAMINWVAPNFLGPLQEFREIYANPIQQGLWVDSTSYERRKSLKLLEVMKKTVQPKVQRATIHCIRNDLPPKHEFVISVAPTDIQKRLYELYLDGITLNSLPQAGLFSVLMDLSLVCNHPRCFKQKAQDMRRKVKDGTSSSFPESVIPAVLKETNGHDIDSAALSRKVELLVLILDEARKMQDKVLVFSQSIPTLNYLENLFLMQKRLVCRLDGNTAVSKRQDMIKSFNTGKQEVYLISTNAGGVGLNIQGANRVVIFDFKWNPVTDQQAVGRAYRFGQKKTVFVYRFLVAGTFEEQLQNKAVFKMQLASRVVDKKNPVSWGKRLGKLFHPIEAVPAHDLTPFLHRDTVLDRLIRYKDNNEAIRQIVSTDTFEEEDLLNQLTAEENQEAEEMYTLERLRHTDRGKYDQLIEQKQKEEQARILYQTPNASQFPSGRLPPSSGQFPRVSQSMDGASDNAFSDLGMQNRTPTSLSQPQHARTTLNETQPQSVPAQPTTAPLPMAGANTFFGRETESAPSVDTGPPATPQRTPRGLETTPTTKKNGLFSQPRSHIKDDFENKLAAILEGLRDTQILGLLGPAKAMAQAITAAIDKARKEESLGFLPDNQRWRLLLDSIQTHERVVTATVARLFTSHFLALASAEEIERRVSILNSLSEEEYRGRLERSVRAPDPSNLHNIHRPNMQSPRAREDMMVMRQAADKRRQRFRRLPAWANQALSGDRSGSS